MDTLEILFVALVFIVIAIGAIRGNMAKPEPIDEDNLTQRVTEDITMGVPTGSVYDTETW